MNKVLLVGNVGRDAEIRTTTTGNPVLNVTVATNERFQDRNGEYKERTDWHRVVLWGDRASDLVEQLRSGRRVFVEGQLKTRSWQNSMGEKRYRTEVVASKLTVLDHGKQPLERSQSDAQRQDFNDDDIPF